MILSSSKVLTVCGLGVGSCISIPLLIAKNKTISPFDLRKISIEEPMIECNTGGRNLKIYLVFNNNWAGATDSDDITLEIVDTGGARGGAKAQRRIIWRSTAIAEYKWKAWDMKIPFNGMVAITVTEWDTNTNRWGTSVIHCERTGIDFKSRRSENSDLSIWKVSEGKEEKRIKFRISENCEQKGRKRECDITFAESNSNLIWSSSFQPKAYFFNGYKRGTETG